MTEVFGIVLGACTQATHKPLGIKKLFGMNGGRWVAEEEYREVVEKKEETIRKAAIAFNQAFKEGKVKKLADGEWVPVIPEEDNADA